MLFINYRDDRRMVLEEFARERHLMEAPRLGGARDVALDYTYSVYIDGKRRNPDASEKAVVESAIWDYRERFLSCRNECQLRLFLGGAWRCMTCGSVWTAADEGRSYGLPLSGLSALRITYVQRDAERESAGDEFYSAVARRDQEFVEEGMRAYDEVGVESVSGPFLLVDTHVSGIHARFLLLRCYGGDITATWCSASGLTHVFLGKDREEVIA